MSLWQPQYMRVEVGQSFSLPSGYRISRQYRNGTAVILELWAEGWPWRLRWMLPIWVTPPMAQEAAKIGYAYVTDDWTSFRYQYARRGFPWLIWKSVALAKQGKSNFFRLMWRIGGLATQEGCAIRWRDLRPPGWMWIVNA